MPNDAQIRLRLNPGNTVKDAQALAAQIKAALGNVKVNGKVVDLGNSSRDVQALATSLRTTYGQAEKFAQSMGLTSGKANEAVSRLRELDRVGATNAQKFKVLQQELGVTATQFNQLNKAARSTNEGLTAIAAGSAAVATAIGVAFTKGLQDFTAFDRAVRQSGVISGSTGTTELAGLREEVERLGIVTSKTPAQVAQMSVALSRAGFTAEETTEAMEGIVRASEASGDELLVVGDIIAKTVRTYSLNASESMRVADALVATANNTNTSVAGLGESLNYVGSTAAASNQPLEDTMVLLGLLGDAGIQGSMAGTNLSAALERLKIASAGGETEFSNLVRGSARMTEAFNVIGASVRNADGSMKSVLDVLPVIQQNLNGLGQADKDVLMKALFGVEGGRAFQTLLNVTPDRLALITGKVREAGGSAQKAGEEMLQGLGGALDLLGGSIGALSSQLGEFAAVGVEPLVRGSINLINAFLGMPDPIKVALFATTAFVGVLASAVAMVTAYNLLNGKFVVQTTLASAATVKDTIAKALNVLTTTQMTAATARQTAAAIAARAATLGQAAATTALSASLIPLLVQLGLVIAAFEGIKFAKFALDMAASNEQIGKFQASVEASSSAAFAAASRTKGAIDRINAARQGGRQLTEQEIADSKRLVAANDVRLRQLQDDLKIAEQLPAADEAQKNAKAQLVQTLQTSIDALQGQNDKLKQAAGLTTAATAATTDQTKATEEQASALDKLASSYQRQASALENSLTARKTAIAQSIAAGQLTEDQARQQTINAEQRHYQQRIELAQQKLQELKAIERSATDPKERENAAQQILEVERQLAGDRLQIAEAAAQRRQQVEEDAASAVKDRLVQIEQSTQAEIRGIRQQQASGAVSEEEAIDRIASLQEQGNRRQIAAIQQRLQVVRRGSEEEADLRQQLGTLEENLVSQQLEAQAQIRQARLADLQSANQQAQAAVAASQQARVTAIREAQLAGVLSAAEAEQQIQQIQQQGSAQTIALKQQELAQVAQLRSEGVITAQQAIEQESQLNQQIADLNLQRIEDEIAARQQAAEQRLAIEQQTADLQFEKQQANLTAQLDLLRSGNDLASARNNLEQERYNTQIKQAEAVGNTAEAERLRKSQSEAQYQFELKSLEAKKKELELQLQLQRNELQRQILQEKRTLRQLEQNGAAEEELQLQRESIALAEEALSAQDQLAQQQRQALDIERQITEERHKQQQIQQQSAQQSSANSESRGSSIDGAGGGGSGGGFTLFGEQISAFTDATNQLTQIVQGSQSAQQQQVEILRLLFASRNQETQQTVEKAIASAGFSDVLDLFSKLQQVDGNAVQDALLGAGQGANELFAELQRLANSADRAGDALDSVDGGGRPVQARRSGGPVLPNQTYLVGEEGPELVVPSRGGYVLTAQQTAAFLNQNRPTLSYSVPSSTPSVDDALLKELRQLRSDLARLRPQQHNAFTLINEQDPYGRVLQLQQSLMRQQLRMEGR